MSSSQRGSGRIDPQTDIRRANGRKVRPPRGGDASAAIVTAAAIRSAKRGFRRSRQCRSMRAFFGTLFRTLGTLSGVLFGPLRHALVAMQRCLCARRCRSTRELPPHAVHAFHRNHASQRQRSDRRDQHNERHEFGYPPTHRFCVLGHQSRTVGNTIARIITRALEAGRAKHDLGESLKPPS